VGIPSALSTAQWVVLHITKKGSAAELYKLNYGVRSGVAWLAKWDCNLIVPLGMV